MYLNSMNLNHLKIFESVYRLGSTVLASQELHLTQSGVSQHIKTLEDHLGTPLFDRIGKRLVPTACAKLLFEQTQLGFAHIEKALTHIQGVEEELSGPINIGMPSDFGNNCVLKILASFAVANPKVELRIIYGLAYEMNKLLLEGKLDFAFVDDFVTSPQLEHEVVYEETLSLYASAKYLQGKKMGRDPLTYFESLHYIDYFESGIILSRWFKHHYHFKHFVPHVRAFAPEVEAISVLIKNHLGAGVLPRHHAEKLNLHCFKEKEIPLKNKISVAYLQRRSHSLVSVKALELIKEKLLIVGSAANFN